jgi:hypothetical protein
VGHELRARGDNIVWGTNFELEGDNIVWGTNFELEGDNIVWGTSSSGARLWDSFVSWVELTFELLFAPPVAVVVEEPIVVTTEPVTSTTTQVSGLLEGGI